MAPALARYAESRLAPVCLFCGGTLRPQVVLFGEPLPGSAWGAAVALVEHASGCLCVGTSLQVYPAAGLAEAFARARGRSRSCRCSRRRSGRTPISALLRSAEDILPAVASILLD